MVFLAINNVVHADLACRNVLVFRFDEKSPRNNVIKITDFGLRQHSQLYSLAPSAARTTLSIVPVRYVAPEILSTRATKEDYTEKSDIYSMGVLMWEAYCRGAIPWSKITADNEVIRRVISGELLPKPANCSEEYWSTICKTWFKSPKERPTFAQLRDLLTEGSHQTNTAAPLPTTDQQQPMYYTTAAAAAAAAGHPPSSPFFIPQNDFQPSIRPQIYTQQRMGQPQYINQGMPAQMQPAYYLQNPQYLPQTSYVPGSNPRAMAPQYMSMARTGNEHMNNQMNFMQTAGYLTYANSNLSPATQMYQQQFFPASYSVAPNDTQQAPQMGNAPQIPAQPQQYTLPANFNPVQAPQQMSQPALPQKHQPIDPSHIPTSQSAPVLQATNKKRQRKPLSILNPDTKAAFVAPLPAPVASVPTTPTPTTTTSETRPVESRTDYGTVVPPVKTTENTSKVQDDFRRDFAELLRKRNEEKSSNNLSAKAAAAAPVSHAKSPTHVASLTSK